MVNGWTVGMPTHHAANLWYTQRQLAQVCK